MRLRTKFSLSILPSVLLAVAIVGVVSIRNTNEAVHSVLPLYTANTLDTYIAQHLEIRHQLLVDNHLETIPSFVDSYEAEAIEAAKAVKLLWPGHFFAVDSDNRLIFCSDNTPEQELRATWEPLLQTLKQDTEPHHQHFADEYYAVHYFQPWDWYVFLAIDAHSAHAFSRRIRNVTLLVGFLAAVLILTALSISFARLVANPMARLSNAAKAIASQEPIRYIPVKSKDEFHDLARDMESMAQQIQEARQHLLSWNEELEHTVAQRTTDLERQNRLLANEIQGRARIEETLRLTQFSVDNAAVPIFQVDEHRIILYANNAATDLVGHSPQQLMGMSITRVIPDLDEGLWARLWNSLRLDKSATMESFALTASNATVPIECTLYLVEYEKQEIAVGFFFDITERINTRELLAQSEKMASVGGLAAGMAHEINNPLAGILGSAQLLQARLLKKTDKNRRAAEECGTSLESIQQYLQLRKLDTRLLAIRELGERAARIVSNMLTFAIPGDVRYEDHDVAEILEQALLLAHNDYDLATNFRFKDIRVEKRYDNPPFILRCDQAGLQQAFFNILKNAAQALASEPRPDPEIRIQAGWDAGQLRISISDNGPGIPPDVLKHIFDPFYTTKAVNMGKGMGLSVAYFIITSNHTGAIQAESNQRTTFTITLRDTH